jgi:hypothetical protein
VTLSRRRLAFIGVAAVAALVLGFVAAKVFGPGHAHPASTAPAAASTTAAPAPATTSPATTPAAPSSSTPAGPPASTPAQAQAPAPGAAAAALPTAAPTVSFSDRRTGFTIAYPRAWTRLTSGDRTVPLLVSSRDGVSLLLRAVALPAPITGRRLAEIRDATGLVIRARPNVQIITGPRLLSSSSLPGFLYIYSFLDNLSHRRVAHSQITLFSGRRMFTLVFQTARAEDLTRFAMLFDKITASFRAL